MVNKYMKQKVIVTIHGTIVSLTYYNQISDLSACCK